MVVARRGDVCAAESWWSRSSMEMVVAWWMLTFAAAMEKMVREGCCWRWRNSCIGGRKRLAAAAVWRVEGEEKIRVRVLGDEDDDVAAFHWTAC